MSVVRGLFPRHTGGSLCTVNVYIDPTNTLPILRGTPVVYTGATITRNGRTLPAIKAVAIDPEEANEATTGALKTTGTPVTLYDSSGGVVSGIAGGTAGEAEITYRADQEYEIVVDSNEWDGTAAKSFINFSTETATPVTSPFASPANNGGPEASSSNVVVRGESVSSATRNFRIRGLADTRDAVSTADVAVIGVINAHQAI